MNKRNALRRSGLFLRLLPVLIVLVTFGLVAAVLTLWVGSGTLYGSVHGLLWSIGGSMALGVLVGLLLEVWTPRVEW